MQRKKMEIAIFWLPIVGGLLLGSFAIGAWYGGSKSFGLWLGFAGTVCLLLVVALQIQGAIWKAESAEPKASDLEIKRLRAYVFVTKSEFRNFGTQNPIVAVAELKNTGLTPAYRLRRYIQAFAGPFPLPEFPSFEVGKLESTLGPSGEVDLGPLSLSTLLTPEQTAAVIAGTWAIYAQGEVRYFDAFDIERTTKFRVFFRGNGTPITPGTILPTGHAQDGNESN